MPRANRYFLPGEVWHLTHRRHKQECLLKFERDRLRWRYGLYHAKKHYGFSVLNSICTANHVHLLVRDTENNTIVKRMQLMAGRLAQEYNQRKSRKGAYWEDHYRIIDHQTLIERFNLRDASSLQQYHHKWVDTQTANEKPKRDPKWTQALAVGSETFVNSSQKSNT